MTEVVVIDVELKADLSAFSRYLWQQKLSHRIIEQDGRQLLLVGSQADAEQVHQAYQLFVSGDQELPDIRPEKSKDVKRLLTQLCKTPVTFSLLLLSLLGYFLVTFDSDYDYVKLFTFFQFETNGFRIVFSLPKEGEYWRLITPIFLHFGAMHIIFNSLWLWDLGRRIEAIQGSDRMIGIVMVMGLGSNISQSILAEVSVFGGMSGVIYGLLGYGWVWSAMCPQKSLHIPQGVINFMLIWLVLCMLGFAELMGAGAVANAAHVGGLIMGIILGFFAGLIAKTGKA